MNDISDHVFRPKSATAALDRHVGDRIRQRRAELGLSEESLADKLGLTSQQMITVETGARRIAAPHLLDLSRILDVPVSYFFDDMAPTRLDTGTTDCLSTPSTNQGMQRDSLDLLRAYHRISDASTRRWVIDLVRALAEN